jgi:hypothetical protein
MLSKHWSRLLPLVFALAFSAIALPAHAAVVLHPSGHYTHQIDWAHPHRAHLPGPGMPRSGIGSDATGDLMPTASITPLGNFPTTCYNNYYYDVIVQGQTTWTRPYGDLTAWVQYQWCPQYSGDTVGINWSYGRDYITSGCANVEVGGATGNNLGAYLYSGNDGSLYNDGENPTQYYICAGHYAWDYSLTAIGSGIYSAWMIGYIPATGYGTTAASPCCH